MRQLLTPSVQKRKWDFLNVKQTLNGAFISNYRYFGVVLMVFSLMSCASRKPKMPITTYTTPTAPDYANFHNWAAHPDVKDMADHVPAGSNLTDEQANAQVDVFFVHPTTYTYQKGFNQWNASLDNEKLNIKTDNGSILYQASLFNNCGRIYAPRYRQAHLSAYFTRDSVSAHAAFELAYADVKAAFEYYLKTWNKGRPIIIAAHSQGAQHAARLLKEFFDDKNLKNKLVVSYLLGMPIKKNTFKTIPVCDNADQTGCFCSWRTFLRGYEPKKYFPLSDDISVVNPLSMTTAAGLVSADKHEGAVLIGFKPLPAHMTDAEIHKGILWVNKPMFRGSFLYRTPNYHAGDFNLFYFNVRSDAQRRIGLFWKQ